MVVWDPTFGTLLKKSRSAFAFLVLFSSDASRCCPGNSGSVFSSLVFGLNPLEPDRADDPLYANEREENTSETSRCVCVDRVPFHRPPDGCCSYGSLRLFDSVLVRRKRNTVVDNETSATTSLALAKKK